RLSYCMQRYRICRHTASHLRTSPTSGIYTLSLHDALPISVGAVSTTCVAKFTEAIVGSSPAPAFALRRGEIGLAITCNVPLQARDRKSTRLNSSHVAISYAVFCLKKKKAGSDDRHCQQEHR